MAGADIHAGRPFRSVLYIPGSKPRALDKARSLAADAIIFDLEDAVAPSEKARARDEVARALEAGGYALRTTIVRVNGLDTPWGGDDLAAVATMKADAVLLPKVSRPEDVAEAEEVLARHGARDDLAIWAMMETPGGILAAGEIATASPRLAGFVLGTNDLLKELHGRFRPDRLPLRISLAMALLAARAAGLVCIDGVYNAFRDTEGLRRECIDGRDMGFDGKTLIHPVQIPIANEVFGPSPEEIEEARRIIEAFEAAEREGQGVAVLDGKIVENLHVETARRTLAQAEAIKAMEAGDEAAG